MIHHSSGKRGLIRRIFSMVIALLLVCSVSIPAFAVSEEPGMGSDGGGETVPTVTYNFYVEGELYHSQTVKDKETLLEPTAPVREKEEFDGWYTAADGGEIFTDFSVQRVTETTTVNLYAGWKTAVEVPAEETGEDVSPAEQPAEETKEDAGSMEQPTADNGISAMSISGPTQVEVGKSITLQGSSSWSGHSWSSSDERIATVRGSENSASVTGVKEGQVTITHRYGWNNSETYNITVTEGNYNLYVYTLIPGREGEMDSGEDPNSVWNGMSIGSITSDVGSPTQKTVGEILHSGDGNINAQVTAGNIDLNEEDFPVITYQGKQYEYARTADQENQEGYYTIQWIRVIVANGANAGNNGHISPTVPANSSKDSTDNNTYHLDGMIVLNMQNRYTVNFAVKDAGEDDFVILDNYSRIVESGYTAKNLERPDTSNPAACPATKTVDGVTYVFDGWYKDETCTQRVDWDTEIITSNITYYAKYNRQSDEDENFINVEKKFTGLTADQIPENFYIRVASDAKEYILTNDNYSWSEETLSDGTIIWRWKISGVGTGNYTVSEGNEEVENYTVTSDGLGESVTVEAAAIGITINRETTCSHTNWPVEMDVGSDTNYVFAATLTQGGVAVISEETLSASVRAAISDEIFKINGPWKGTVYFYSVEEQMATGQGFELNGATITYDEGAGEIIIGNTSHWQQVARLSYSISAAANPEIAVINAYKANTQDITIQKIVKGALGDVQKEFAFSYRFGDGLEGSFTLRDQESYTIEDVPLGSTLTVKETDAQGYETSAVYGDSPVTVTGGNNEEMGQKSLTVTVEAEKGSVTITNTKDAIPDTGVHLNNKPYILMAAIVFAVAAGAIVGKLRKRFG